MTIPIISKPMRFFVFTGWAVWGIAGLEADSVQAGEQKPAQKTLDFQFQTPWGEAAPDAVLKTRPMEAMNNTGHRHVPVDVEARPIVRRFKANLNRPRRVIQDSTGAILVADWADGTIVKIDADGDATLLVTELNEPAGLAFDGAGQLFIANHGSGMMRQGNILKISPTGERLLFAEDLNGPTALAFDAQGDLYVSEFHGNRILRITPAGLVSVFVDNIPTPAALAFDLNGYLYTASSTEGTVYRVSPMGNVELFARGLIVPSDLAFDPQQHLIVTNFGGTQLTYVDPMGGTKPFAIVPKGTIGIQFDTTGNLIFVNWDYQTLMKVTTNLQIPCPHCEKMIPLRLRPRLKPKPPRENETPAKPQEPFI